MLKRLFHLPSPMSLLCRPSSCSAAPPPPPTHFPLTLRQWPSIPLTFFTNLTLTPLSSRHHPSHPPSSLRTLSLGLFLCLTFSPDPSSSLLLYTLTLNLLLLPLLPSSSSSSSPSPTISTSLFPQAHDLTVASSLLLNLPPHCHFFVIRCPTTAPSWDTLLSCHCLCSSIPRAFISSNVDLQIRLAGEPKLFLLN